MEQNMNPIMIQRTRRKRMNKEEIEKIIKEYLKENLRLETRLEYLDEYSNPENYMDVYLGDEKIQEVSLNQILDDNENKQ